jgi:hypothetical protein
VWSGRLPSAESKGVSAHPTNLRKIKRASGFFRTQDARAALPQNCSLGNVRLSGKCENGTRVPTCPPKVPAGKSHITKAVSKVEPISFYSESTIFPGATTVEKGEPVIAVGAPVDGS